MSGVFAAGRHWDVTPGETKEITEASKVLAANGIPDALKEARLLFGAAMPKKFTDHDEMTDGTMIARFKGLVDRRCAHEPLSHLVGYRDFYEHRFTVTADVLDPRPDTEALVLAALDGPFLHVLDLGTGSGCILLSLLAARPGTTGLGTDLSETALAVATQNMMRMELNTRARFELSDWFAGVEGQFDLMVSNPPYIALDEMDGLQPEVRLHEPRIALTDEADGLSCYKKISAGVSDHLSPGGRLIVEIGPTQAEPVQRMFADAGLVDIEVRQDLDSRDRVVSGKMP